MKLRRRREWAFYRASLDSKLKYFCIITVLLILINRGNAWIAGNELEWALSGGDLLRVLLMSFFGVLPSSVIHMLIEADSTKGVLQIHIINFISTTALVLGAFVFTEPGGGITLRTIVIYLAIYASISVYSYFNAAVVIIEENKMADEINKRLGEFHKDENEAHTD